MSLKNSMHKLYPFIFIVALLGCTSAPITGHTPAPQASITPTLEQPVQTDETPLPLDGPVTLKLWVPPEFDPLNGSPEGELFQMRLDEFTQRRSNIRINTRVKAIDGPGGIIDTLTSAAATAPLALPDLVALPSNALESAAIKGLLNPFDGLTKTMDEAEWYGFARTFSQIENTTVGIPFAGDALIMVYRPSIIRSEIGDWAASLETAGDTPITLSFPAADPYSLFTLLHYQSIGGAIFDDENRPTLDAKTLTEVLAYYQQAKQSSLMPFWLTQYETDDQSWAAYENNRTDLVVTWASRFLQNPPVDSAGAAIPTRDDIPFTFATGWAWALASPDPDRQEISAQLAEFLTSGEFLGEWTAAGGYMPPRSDALAGWDNVSMQTLLALVAPSAQLISSMDVLATLGPPLQSATIDILKEQANPASAAEEAVSALAQP